MQNIEYIFSVVDIFSPTSGIQIIRYISVGGVYTSIVRDYSVLVQKRGVTYPQREYQRSSVLEYISLSFLIGNNISTVVYRIYFVSFSALLYPLLVPDIHIVSQVIGRQFTFLSLYFSIPVLFYPGTFLSLYFSIPALFYPCIFLSLQNYWKE